MYQRLFAGLFIALCLSPIQHRDPVPSQEHIQQVISSLPPDSEMRLYLQRGDRGDGIHYPRMDQMKSLGVRRARVFLDFAWSSLRRRPVDIHLRRIALYNSYDENCSQITDAEQLKFIEKSGLKAELEKFAAAKTAESNWTFVDKRPRASHGLATVELMDDEWLPLFSPSLMPLNDQGQVRVDGDAVDLQETLKSAKLSQDALDGALFEASSYLDDACTIELLLSAGAKPNSRNIDGQTPLMQAAYSGHIHSVEALLRGGADPGIKANSGETAADIAQKRRHQVIAAVLKQKLH
jgi:hypothetical protein